MSLSPCRVSNVSYEAYVYQFEHHSCFRGVPEPEALYSFLQSISPSFVPSPPVATLIIAIGYLMRLFTSDKFALPFPKVRLHLRGRSSLSICFPLRITKSSNYRPPLFPSSDFQSLTSSWILLLFFRERCSLSFLF